MGIGNPGRRYAQTRHNVGWEIVDRLAKRHGLGAPRRRFEGLVYEGRLGQSPVVLVRPTTFVNASGRCVSKVIGWYGVEVGALLVCVDDINLPLGRLRVRRQGSSGGHNGLASIIESLGTEAFARLRVGVGRTEADSQVAHVLGRFSAAERPIIAEAIERAADAVTMWVGSGIEACMSAFN